MSASYPNDNINENSSRSELLPSMTIAITFLFVFPPSYLPLKYLEAQQRLLLLPCVSPEIPRECSVHLMLWNRDSNYVMRVWA